MLRHTERMAKIRNANLTLFEETEGVIPRRRLGIILKCALKCIKFTWGRLYSFGLRQGPAACCF